MVQTCNQRGALAPKDPKQCKGFMKANTMRFTTGGPSPSNLPKQRARLPTFAAIDDHLVFKQQSLAAFVSINSHGIGSQVINALFSLLCVPKHSPTCANDGYPACNFIQKLHFSHRTLTLRTSDANCPGPVFIKCLCLGQPVLLINSATCQSFVHVIGASTRDSDDYTMCHNSCFSPQRKNTIRRSN